MRWLTCLLRMAGVLLAFLAQELSLSGRDYPQAGEMDQGANRPIRFSE